MSFLRTPDGQFWTFQLPDGARLLFPLPRNDGTPPSLSAGPTLTLNGTLKVGQTATVGHGTWADATSVAHHLMRGQEVLVANVANSYVHTFTAADDGKSIYVREVATSAWGNVEAQSLARVPSHVAPAASGSISAVTRTQGSGVYTFDASTAFTGLARVYSISGSDAVSIDAQGGTVSIATGATLAATTITVTAANSGGSVNQTFSLTINAGTDPGTPTLAGILATDVKVTFEVDPAAGTGGIPAGAATWMFEITGGPATAATKLWWAGVEAPAGSVPGAGFHPCIAHPSVTHKWIARASTPADLDTPRLRDWLWVNRGDSYDQIGKVVKETLIWTDSAGNIASSVFSAFSATLSQTCAVGTTPPPSTGLVSKRMPLTYPEEATAGAPPGDHMQNCHGTMGCYGSPNVVAMVQDTGGLWLSRDHGRTWRKPLAAGLATFQGLGVAIDPQNANHIIVNMGGSYVPNLAHQGIWRSIDGGASFTKIASGVHNARRGTQMSIAFAPGSGLSGGRTKNVLAIACGEPSDVTVSGSTVTGSDVAAIVGSTDGGATWTSRGTWDGGTRGRINFMVGDASSDTRFYATTGQGLWRITDAFSGTFTATKLSGSNGLPAGGIAGQPYVSADGQTIIVGNGSGIYKSTNGGGAFSKVGSHNDLSRLWVNPYDPTKMLTTAGQTGTQRPYYSTDSGATFTLVSAANVAKRASAGSTISMLGNFVGIAWHTDGSVFMHGRATSLPNAANNYRSSNLTDWVLANEGYCGTNFGMRGLSPSMFASASKFAICMIDLGPRLSLNSGASFGDCTFTLTTFSPTLTERTCNGVAVSPDTNVLMASVQANNSRLLRSTDNGATWSEPATADMGDSHTIIKGGGTGASTTWFAGRRKSTDNGATWAVMANLPTGYVVCATTFSGTQNIFAYNLAGGVDTFYRSSDQGATWTLVLTMPYNNKITSMRFGPLAAHPSDPDILFTKGPNDWTIRRWDLSSGAHNTRPWVNLSVFGGSNGVPGGYPVTFELKMIAIDPRYPLILHALTSNGGGPRLYRTTDGGATAWEELGGDVFPMGCNANALATSPFTGDTIVGGSNGTFVLHPTYAQAGTIFGALPYDSYLGEAA